jgi:thiol:disulfide interchange protein DsbC
MNDAFSFKPRLMRLSLAGLAMLMGLNLVQAAPTDAVATQVYQALQQELKAVALPGLNVKALHLTPATEDPNFWHTVAATYTFYISTDASFILRNHYFATEILSEKQRRYARQQALTALDENELIVFSPTSTPRYEITVFTDAACPFSAKFHQEIPMLTAAGVKVRYILYPRSGANSSDYLLNQSVWCSKERQQALNETLAGAYPETEECAAPLLAYTELGESFAVEGTPTLVFEDGSQYLGYYSSSAILNYLTKGAPLTVPLL